MLSRTVEPVSAERARPATIDVLLWCLAVLAIAGTIVLSLSPGKQLEKTIVNDKVGHALAYAVDTFLLLLAVVWRPGRPQALERWALPIVLGVAILGGVIEFAQDSVGRDPDPRDWFADLIGIGVAVLAFALLRRVYERSLDPA